MYNVLIVDDEKIEREGIKLLIKKYNLELNVFEAENGKMALEYIKSNPIDILFTDIKMPFMSGLELADNAKQLYPHLKVIIYSAFGEFDYAKKAINIKVEHYILKPIKKDEFQKVFTEVITQCDNEKIEKEEAKKIQTIYMKGIQYEKEKVLLDIINGTKVDELIKNRLDSVGLDFNNKFIQMIMVDFKSRFFDLNNDEFIKTLQNTLKQKYEYLNLNERQSLIFLCNSNKELDRDQLEKYGTQLIEEIGNKYHIYLTIVFGDSIRNLEDIYPEFNSIEQILAYKFFYEKSLILFTRSDYTNETQLQESVEKTVDNIYCFINTGDYSNMKREIEKLFQNLMGKESFSDIYVKYVCSEILKRIVNKIQNKKYDTFKSDIEKIFICTTLSQLKEILDSAMAVIISGNKDEGEEVNKKVIKTILKLVEENYMKDISVEWVADKVYLSPNYLCFIFKKQMGQSLGKYITTYRLKVAEKLLQTTNMKIVDLCEKVGYTNTSYFCLTFKNYYGVSPMKFRDLED